jgi:hypothetical protein
LYCADVRHLSDEEIIKLPDKILIGGTIYAKHLDRNTFLDRMESAIKEQVMKGDFFIPGNENGQNDLPKTPGQYFTETIQKAFKFLYGETSCKKPYVHCVKRIYEEINLRLAFAMVMRLGVFRTPETTKEYFHYAFFTHGTPIKNRYNYVLGKLRLYFIRSGFGWDGNLLNTAETYFIEHEREMNGEQVRPEKAYYPAHHWKSRIIKVTDNSPDTGSSSPPSSNGPPTYTVDSVNKWAEVDTVIYEANVRFNNHKLGSIGPVEVRRLKTIFNPCDAVKLRQYFEEILKPSLDIKKMSETKGQFLACGEYVAELQRQGWRQLPNTSIWCPMVKPTAVQAEQSATADNPSIPPEEAILYAVESELGSDRFQLWFNKVTIKLEESRITFTSTTRLGADMLRSNCFDSIKAAVATVLGADREIRIDWVPKPQVSGVSTLGELLPELVGGR